MDCFNKCTAPISTCFLVLPVAFPFGDSCKKHSSSFSVDCKTVRIFAYSSTRKQSNKRSGTKLKTVRLLHHTLPISLLILRKNPTVLQSTFSAKFQGFSFKGAFTDKRLHKNSDKQWNVYIQKETFTSYYALLSMIFSLFISFALLFFGSFIVLPLLLDLFHDKLRHILPLVLWVFSKLSADALSCVSVAFGTIFSMVARFLLINVCLHHRWPSYILPFLSHFF